MTWSDFRVLVATLPRSRPYRNAEVHSRSWSSGWMAWNQDLTVLRNDHVSVLQPSDSAQFGRLNLDLQYCPHHDFLSLDGDVCGFLIFVEAAR